MTITYWQIGRRIVEQEQEGADRATYGEELVARLAKDLSARFGRGFSRSNVFQMRQFLPCVSRESRRCLDFLPVPCHFPFPGPATFDCSR